MWEYEAVADIEIEPDGAVDLVMYLAYCPNYEPWEEERDEYPEDREILDPLKSRTTSEKTNSQESKPTLMARLEENKQKVASQEQSRKSTNQRTGGMDHGQ